MPLKTVLMFYSSILKKRTQFFSNKKHNTIFILYYQFCLCSINFFLFSDLSRSRRKKHLDLKVVFSLRLLLYPSLSVRCLVCTLKVTLSVIWLLGVLCYPLKVALCKKFFLHEITQKKQPYIAVLFWKMFCTYLFKTQQMNQIRHFIIKVLTAVDVIDYYLL